jgi:hypothetical protein
MYLTVNSQCSEWIAEHVARITALRSLHSISKLDQNIGYRRPNSMTPCYQHICSHQHHRRRFTQPCTTCIADRRVSSSASHSAVAPPALHDAPFFIYLHSPNWSSAVRDLTCSPRNQLTPSLVIDCRLMICPSVQGSEWGHQHWWFNTAETCHSTGAI